MLRQEPCSRLLACLASVPQAPIPAVAVASAAQGAVTSCSVLGNEAQSRAGLTVPNHNQLHIDNATAGAGDMCRRWPTCFGTASTQQHLSRPQQRQQQQQMLQEIIPPYPDSKTVQQQHLWFPNQLAQSQGQHADCSSTPICLHQRTSRSNRARQWHTCSCSHRQGSNHHPTLAHSSWQPHAAHASALHPWHRTSGATLRAATTTKQHRLSHKSRSTDPCSTLSYLSKSSFPSNSAPTSYSPFPCYLSYPSNSPFSRHSPMPYHPSNSPFPRHRSFSSQGQSAIHPNHLAPHIDVIEDAAINSHHLGPHTETIADIASSCLAASISEVQDTGGVPMSTRATILRSAAGALEGLHEFTGLPWWATIPLASWCLRTALLPFSMWQAKTVRTNYLVYKEAVGLTDKQLGISQQADGKQANHDASSDAAENRRRLRVLLSNFALLRTKLGAPHPAWVLINPLIQLPCFVVMGATLRMMGGLGWPGMSTGGVLWFQDLTQVALIPGTVLPCELDLPWLLPMGVLGPVLPLTLLAMTATSLRLGFGAAGATQAEAPQDWIGRSMRLLPGVLYGLAGLNTWVAMQLPHAALLHWLASASFTLGLQTALQNPGFRAAFKLPSASELRDTLSRVVNQRLQQLSEEGGVLGPGRGYAVSSIPESLLKQVAGENSADILVILGAQHSAAKRYREALYCLDKALQNDPKHVRAHYARGQVFSLNNRWVDAEACYRQAAALAPPGPEKGQALYCMATALHTQGKLDAAVVAYQQAADMWPGQPVVAFSLANVLTLQGRLQEARTVVRGALGLDMPVSEDAGLTPVNAAKKPGVPPGPFKAPLTKLLDQIEGMLQQQKEQQHQAQQQAGQGEGQ